jgi:hypothetical protein
LKSYLRIKPKQIPPEKPDGPEFFKNSGTRRPTQKKAGESAI